MSTTSTPRKRTTITELRAQIADMEARMIAAQRLIAASGQRIKSHGKPTPTAIAVITNLREAYKQLEV